MLSEVLRASCPCAKCEVLHAEGAHLARSFRKRHQDVGCGLQRLPCGVVDEGVCEDAKAARALEPFTRRTHVLAHFDGVSNRALALLQVELVWPEESE